jgi:hypothetical protein
MQDQAGVGRYTGTIVRAPIQAAPGNARYNCPGTMTPRRRSLATLAALVSGVALISAQPGDIAARIRAEGQQRSRALALFRTLTDDIGARLTGSPAHMRAARWALDRFAEWGLANPHLEPYEFGRGWQLEQLSVAMTEPRSFRSSHTPTRGRRRPAAC